VAKKPLGIGDDEVISLVEVIIVGGISSASDKLTLENAFRTTLLQSGSFSPLSTYERQVENKCSQFPLFFIT